MPSEPTRQRHLMALAGAGTGKTHLLASGYLDHLQDFTPIEVVAVTFTERAAAELRSRIRAHARAALLPNDIIVQLDAAPIGTIHALAARICRDHPTLAGVPTSFTVMDALQTRQWRTAHLPLALQNTRPDVLTLLPYSRLSAILYVLLEEPYETLRRLDGDPATRQERWKTLLEDARLHAWQRLTAQSAWQNAQAQLTVLEGAAGDRLEELRGQIIHALSTPEYPFREAVLTIASAKLTVGSKKAWNGDDLRLTKEAIERLRDIVRGEPLLTIEWNAQDDVLLTVLPALEQGFSAIHDQLYTWRYQQGQLDFTDLEGRALAALEHQQVRDHYRTRFKAVLVDECQDTSPAQVKLLQGVSGGAVKTYVGDPLQSIYGFRTGRTLTHEALAAEITQQGGEQMQLTQSYRTHRGLIGLLNAAMHFLTEGQHLELSATREAPDETVPMTFLQVSADGSRSNRLQNEAQAIAQEIKTLIDSGTLIFDRELGRKRPVRPGDIAILARAWKPLDSFQTALLNSGIPAFQAGGGDLLGTPQARDAWVMLRAAGNAADDLAAAAVLRGPLFNFQDTQLHQLWDSRLDRESWQAALQRSTRPEHGRAKRFFQHLRTLRHAPAVEPLLLADRFGYRHVLSQQADATRRIADWDAMLELVASLEPECPTPRAAAHRLRRLQEEQVRLPRPPIAVPDAVTLSSVHHAKGMEWPVVFVVDLGGTNRPDASVAQLTEVGVVFSPDPFEKERPAMTEYARQLKKQADDQELSRLLYVASTRVRDRLYASGSTGNRAPAFTRMQDSFRAAGATLRDLSPAQGSPHEP